jgi:dTDP-4-amino-4,6-dideoxygalactose transaminase
VDIGSSYLPSELIAAFLWAQMEEADAITARRLGIWQRYHDAFADLEQAGKVVRPKVPAHCRHNAHMYQLLLPDLEKRTAFIATLKAQGIGCVFHYVPLHSAPAGRHHGRAAGELPHTLELSDRLVRLPLWVGLEAHQDEVIRRVIEAAQ